jgi:hypothetical protein
VTSVKSNIKRLTAQSDRAGATEIPAASERRKPPDKNGSLRDTAPPDPLGPGSYPRFVMIPASASKVTPHGSPAPSSERLQFVERCVKSVREAIAPAKLGFDGFALRIYPQRT